MITVLSNSYNPREMKAIHEVMCTARSKFLEKYCGEQRCEFCDYRHVCYDLDKATDYTLKLDRGEEK